MYFETPTNFVPYDPAKWVLTIKSPALDSIFTVDGLHTFNGSKTQDLISITEANSGMATPNIIRSFTGELPFEVWESSPSNPILDKLAVPGVHLSFTLENPTLPGKKVSSAYAFLKKPADVKGDKEVATNSYVFACVNYKSESGSSEVVE